MPSNERPTTWPLRSVRRNHRWAGLAAASLGLLMSAAVLAACSGSSASGSPAGTDSRVETSSITYPLTGVSAASGGLIYAVREGYFKKYGLSVTTPASSEGPVKTGIASGSFPIEGVAGSDVLDLQGHGYPLEIVGCAVGSGAGNGFHIIVKSSIKSASAIPAGAKVGVPSLLGAPQFAMDQFLAAHGISPSKVTYVPLGSIPDVLAALEAGQITVAPLSVPFDVQAIDKGFKDLGTGNSPPTPITVNSKWEKSNPNTILAFLKGYIEGVWYYDTHKSKALPVLASFLGDDLSNPAQASLVEAGYSQDLPPASNVFGTCKTSYFSPYVPFYPKAEQSKIHISKLINNSYINKLVQEGFYTKLKKEYGALKGVNPPNA